MEVTFKKRHKDFNKGDTEQLVELAALYGVDEQKMLTRLLALDVIEFPGKRYLVKPTPKGTVKKKPLTSVSKPKTAKKTAESSGKKEVSNGL